uniref:IMV surface protein n=1 Tax=Parastrongyloides trichosuri TaxID=131310 RepID=A0A0N4ZJ69_PARTI
MASFKNECIQKYYKNDDGECDDEKRVITKEDEEKIKKYLIDQSSIMTKEDEDFANEYKYNEKIINSLVRLSSMVRETTESCKNNRKQIMKKFKATIQYNDFKKKVIHHEVNIKIDK